MNKTRSPRTKVLLLITAARGGWAGNHGTHTSGVRVGAPRLTIGSLAGYPEIFYPADYNGTSRLTTVNSSSSLNPTSAISLEARISPDRLPSNSSTIMRKDSQYLLRLRRDGAIAFHLWIGCVETGLTNQ